jgi:aminobenzoyl-glutamate utilization protein B
VIALLGEYDALAGLSQQAHCAEPRRDAGSQRPRLWAQSAGHRGIRRRGRRQSWLQQHGGSGTMRFYGCPGEEGGSGKPLWCAKGCLMMSMPR